MVNRGQFKTITTMENNKANQPQTILARKPLQNTSTCTVTNQKLDILVLYDMAEERKRSKDLGLVLTCTPHPHPTSITNSC